MGARLAVLKAFHGAAYWAAKSAPWKDALMAYETVSELAVRRVV